MTDSIETIRVATGMSFDFFICEPLKAVNRANVCAVSVAASLPSAMMPPKVNPKIDVANRDYHHLSQVEIGWCEADLPTVGASLRG
jgi:hypothetical protein